MFHASNHITPVPATEDEVNWLLEQFMCLFNSSFGVLINFFLSLLVSQIEAEARAVRSVADALCPLQIVLDRVVLTSTGVLLGCWQVSFYEPYVLFWFCQPFNIRQHEE